MLINEILSNPVFQTIIDFFDRSVLIFDVDANIIYANDACVEMHGYSSKEELLRQKGKDLRVNYDEKLAQEDSEAITKQQDQKFGRIMNFRKKDGTIFTADVHIRRIKDSSGAVVGTIEISTPIEKLDVVGNTLMKMRPLSAHEDIMREKKRTYLARELHDELGQTMTAMRYSVFRLKKELPDANAAIKKIIAELFVYIDMTNESIQRISSDLRPALLDDFGLIAAIRWQAKKFHDSTQINYELSIDPKIPPLPPEIDTVLFRIFQEALTNVARHAQASLVKITFTYTGRELYLEIKDNGKGILPEQLNSPDSFGIAGMQERARSFGGKVMIFSEPKEGTTLYVTMPMTTDMVFETKGKVVFGSDKKVLIADDHPTFRDGLKKVVNSISGIIVTDETGTGQETLEKLRQNEYDMLILDISMPGSNGLDLLKEIKRQKPKLPVLVLSMHPEEEYGLRAIRAGASGYLTKKENPDELLKAIQKVAGGGKFITATLSEELAYDHEFAAHGINMALSDREHQILKMIVQGMNINGIVEQLHLCRRTIYEYRRHILDKTGTKNNIELVRWAMKNKVATDVNLDNINITAQEKTPFTPSANNAKIRDNNKHIHYTDITNFITDDNGSKDNLLKQNKEKLSSQIIQWITSHRGWRETKEIDKELGITTPKDKNYRRVTLFRLEKQGIIERNETDSRKLRYINKRRRNK